ncbi:MAG: hypothetical protein ACT4P7_22935 [Gemmatimonadaceae bacterium]
MPWGGSTSWTRRSARAPASPLYGLVVTVNARPADNLMVHKALELCGAGEIVVVNTCGNTTSAVFGELMCHTAVAQGLGGIVMRLILERGGLVGYLRGGAKFGVRAGDGES